MNTYEVTILPGDGIGPEVMGATVRLLKALEVPLALRVEHIGEMAERQSGDGLPERTLRSIEETRVALKGPTGTPVGGNRKSYNVALRQRFDTYANVRPVSIRPGVKTRYSGEPIDIVVVRENTEGEYVAQERMLDDGSVEVVSRFSPRGCERIAHYAFEYARRHGRRKVTVVHKANIFQMSHGLMLSSAREVAAGFPEIEIEDLIADNFFRQLILRPTRFDVVVTTNLFGDLISDASAALVGGLGFAPGANIGDTHAIFEAVHGTAPDIVGKRIANPSPLMLSSAMMLDHLGEAEAGARVRGAIDSALRDGVYTGDVSRNGSVGMDAFADAVIARL